MRFFDNSDINRTYVQSALATTAAYIGEVFVFAYLLKSGFSIVLVFCAMAGWAFSRLLLRQMLLPAVLKFGLRNCLIFGTLVDAAAFLIVSQIHQPGFLLIGYIFCSALGNSFYYGCYHTVMTMIGDAGKRGAQVSFRESVSALLSVIGPLLGAYLLVNFGPLAAFVFAATLLVLSIIPLFGIRDLPIKMKATVAPAAKRQVWNFYFADGLRAAANYYVWSIALFEVLGENFTAFGAVLAAAAGIGALMSLGVGKLIDVGQKSRANKIAFAVMAATTILKAFGYSAVWPAIIASAVSAIAMPLYASVTMARAYDLSHQSDCPLRFQIIGEGAWDVGVIAGCGLAALMVWLGLGFFWPIILGVVACWLAYLALAENQVEV
jgi:MFS transporter, DHA1 family, inner membrane transport protein